MIAPPIPVVFIHGLWIHSDAWQPWVELYRAAGYDAVAPGWPGDSASGSGAVTSYHAFPDRGHSLVLDHGWREVAGFTLSWLANQEL